MTFLPLTLENWACRCVPLNLLSFAIFRITLNLKYLTNQSIKQTNPPNVTNVTSEKWLPAFSKALFIFTCMCVLSASMCLHHVSTWCPQKPEEGGLPGTGITGSCEPPCGSWELNLGPHQEQQLSPLLRHLSRPLLLYFALNLLLYRWGRQCHQILILGK